MSKSAHRTCVLCRRQYKSICSKFLQNLIKPAASIAVLQNKFPGAVDRQAHFIFCSGCQQLLMKFQLLQERLEELKTLNAKKSAALATTVRMSMSLPPAGEGHHGRHCDTVVALTHEDEAVVDITSEVEDEDEPISELSAEPVDPDEELITEEPGELVQILTTAEAETSGSLEGSPNTAAVDPFADLEPRAPVERMTSLEPEVGECVEKSTTEPSKAVEEFATELAESTDESISEPDDPSDPNWGEDPPDVTDESSEEPELPSTGKEADEVDQNLSEDSEVDQTALDARKNAPGWVTCRIKEVSKNKFLYIGKYPFHRTSRGYRCGSCDHDAKVGPEGHCRSRFSLISKHIREQHLDKLFTPVVEVSQNKFQYLGKHLFEGTSFGYQCGACDYYTVFSKGYGGPYKNMVRHIQESHLGGKQSQGKSRLVQLSPGKFLYGKFQLEKIGEEFLCKLCNQGLKNLHQISRHFYRHRRRGERTEWICETCGKVLKSFDGFKHHKKTHQEPSAPAVICEECGKSFKYPSMLKYHQDRVHLKRKAFTCSYCGRQFFTNNQLRGHEYVHTGVKTYECKICGKKFAHSSALWQHSLHHKGKKYECDICGLQVVQSYHVTRHKNTAHPGWRDQDMQG